MSSSNYNAQYQRRLNSNRNAIYGENIFQEVERYAIVSQSLIESEEFDIIHAHDWMTIKAGILAKQKCNKPLIMHIHATEFDRTGGNRINETVYSIEKWGMEQADKVIAVSEFTKKKIIKHYGIDPKKIEVLHNAISWKPQYHNKDKKPNEKIVLFIGRLTLQKGPDYFLKAAKKISEIRDDILFIIAGSGDMQHALIEQAAQLGISDKVLFTGFLRGSQLDKIYSDADVFVMPSVSEPFGLTALEAIQNGTPVILSKQSGVSEVIKHCLRVDFWDINQMVGKILSILDYNALKKELSSNSLEEIKKFSWDKVAIKCINNLYNLLWR